MKSHHAQHDSFALAVSAILAMHDQPAKPYEVMECVAQDGEQAILDHFSECDDIAIACADKQTVYLVQRHDTLGFVLVLDFTLTDVRLPQVYISCHVA